jgi:hypothetical protein
MRSLVILREDYNPVLFRVSADQIQPYARFLCTPTNPVAAPNR